MGPIKNKSIRPKSNIRCATIKQEKEVKKIFRERGVKVGPYRMKTLLRRRFGKDMLGGYKVTNLEHSLAGLEISAIKGIYKRQNLKPEKKGRPMGKFAIYMITRELHVLNTYMETPKR